MRTSIQLVSLKDVEFHFFFDIEGHPTIDSQNKIYNNLVSLFQDFPFLNDPYSIHKSAQIINFLLKGIEFQLIEDVEKFKEDYQQQIEAEQMHLNGSLPKLSDYGTFDISIMHPPHIKENKLIFFVKEDYTSLPYRVTIPFPITQPSPEISYELLPFL